MKNLKKTKFKVRARKFTGFNGILIQADSVAVNPWVLLLSQRPLKEDK